MFLRKKVNNNNMSGRNSNNNNPDIETEEQYNDPVEYNNISVKD